MKLFRAYDTNKKEWFGESGKNGMSISDIVLYGQLTKYFIDQLQDFIITQYLHIDDSKNNKVYEGDIIKYQVAQIIDGKFVEIDRTYAIGLENQAYEAIKFIKGLQKLGKPFEVVGNIFQDPDYLKIHGENCMTKHRLKKR